MQLRREDESKVRITMLTFLLLLINSTTEGLLTSSISRSAISDWRQKSPSFLLNSRRCSAFYNNAFRSSPQGSYLVATLDVNSLASDGETHADREGEKQQPWWKSFRLKDEKLSKTTRPDFTILKKQLGEGDNGKPLVYLDSAATSQKPNFVTDKMTWYYHNTNSNVHRGAHTLSQEATNMYEAARDQVAKFVNAKSRNEVIFTSGATEAINLVAYSWGMTNLQPGDEIILTVAEHHSNIVPWQIISEQTGALIKYVPIIQSNNGEELDWDGSFMDLLTENTKLVSFQHASNVLGNVNPVNKIVQMIKAKASPKCLIMLDACQSVPHLPVDVQSLGVDFLAASGHKMCGPTGIGFLWGREELLNSMPPFKGGGEMINEVFLTHSTYASAPGRFEAGTPAISEAIGLGAAVEYLSNIGMDRIAAHEHELAEYMHNRMKEIPGIRILGPPDNRSAIVAFVAEDVHPSDCSTFLDMEGIAIRAGHHCCQPLHRELGISHSARASLYFYNTREEIDFFIEKLEETLEFFRSVGDSDNGFF